MNLFGGDDPPKTTTYQLQEELTEWLADLRPWTHFATWTFGKAWPDGPTREAVRFHVDRWLEQQDVLDAFWVVERGMSGSRRAHAHGLLHGIGALALPIHGPALWSDWSARYGRCRFDRLISRTDDVAWYCSKYTFKRGLQDVAWFLRSGPPAAPSGTLGV